MLLNLKTTNATGPPLHCSIVVIIINLRSWCLSHYLVVIATNLYYFLSRCCTAYSLRIFFCVAADKLISLPTKMAASSVEQCWWTVCGHKYLATQTNFNGGTLNIFDTSETSQNYFARVLLSDYY